MPSIKTSLGLTICLTLALALGPVEPARAWTDPCASYLAQIGTLQHKIAVDQQQLIRAAFRSSTE